MKSRRLIRRIGTSGGSGQRTRYFFNGLTEEITKVSVAGAHTDGAFQRYVKWGHASTSGGPKTEPGTGGPSGWDVVYDADRRQNVYEIVGWEEDGTFYWGSGNGYDIPGYRTFATWLKGTGTTSDYEFVLHFDSNQGRKALVYRPNRDWTTVETNFTIIGIDGLAGDFDEGNWARLERDFVADAQAAWSGISITRVTGITLWSATGGTIWMDGLSFSNSLTVEQNVLGPGVIAHIMRNRTIDPSNYSLTDSWFHYDQVGSVMLASNASGTQQTAHYQDAWGNVLQSWQTGRWDGGASGWHHNTKAMDGDLGLVYMYQRWYFPEFGIFAAVAPYPLAKEHAYAFAFGDPSIRTDARGTYATWGNCDCGPGAAGLPTNQTLIDMINARELNAGLKECMKKQVRNVTIWCKRCSEATDGVDPIETYAYTYRGRKWKPYGVIFICRNGPWQGCGARDMAKIILHEIAHTCGWRHNQGLIPGNSGSYDCLGF